MKRVLTFLVGGLLALVAIAFLVLWVWGNSRHANATPEALAALASDSAVTVEDGRFLVFRPTAAAPRMGVVFYPGANCDIHGYAPVLRRLAAAGYFVVDVPMPLEFAFLAPNRALAVEESYPAVTRWAIIGHSLGGAMAASFVFNHPDAVTGLVIWDSYPAPNNSLAAYPRPVWHVHRAKPDGSPPPAFTERRQLFPPDSRWVAIPGGIHMYFGSFVGGGFKEDWEPGITRAEQQDQAVAATLTALRVMETGS